MIVKVTAKRQVTFPARVLQSLGRVVWERLAPLRGELTRGRGSFDLDRFRDEPHDRSLRD